MWRPRSRARKNPPAFDTQQYRGSRGIQETEMRASKRQATPPTEAQRVIAWRISLLRDAGCPADLGSHARPGPQI